MHQNDFDGFKAVLHQLSEAFSKKPSNELTQAYWKALKDLPLSTVTRMADSHTRYAKFFPKPFELRPKDAPVEQKSDGSLEVINNLSVKNWNRRFQEDQIATKWALVDAFMARINVMHEEGSEDWESKMDLCRKTARELWNQCGDVYAGADLKRRQVISQLFGGQAMMNCIQAYKAQQQIAP